MWHLTRPSAETLKWYKDTYLEDLTQAVRGLRDAEYLKEILLPDDGDEVIERLLLWPPEKLYPFNEELEGKIRAKGGWDSARKIIYDVFDYDGRISKNKNAAYELAKRIGTRTCVYCNRIYAFTVETEDGFAVSRPDFDHWLPKKKYPLLSLSIYNLIPSCPICNRGVRLSEEFSYGTHIHPYSSKGEMAARFQYAPVVGGGWKLTLTGGTKEEAETAKALRIEAVYKPYANNEVKDILDFAYNNTPEYLMDLKEIVMKAYGGTISSEQVYRLMFGTSMQSSLFLDRPLSKLKRDVLKQLQEALKIELIDYNE